MNPLAMVAEAIEKWAPNSVTQQYMGAVQLTTQWYHAHSLLSGSENTTNYPQCPWPKWEACIRPWTKISHHQSFEWHMVYPVLFAGRLNISWTVVNIRKMKNGKHKFPLEVLDLLTLPIFCSPVNWNGIKCPRCIALLLGPLPVYYSRTDVVMHKHHMAVNGWFTNMMIKCENLPNKFSFLSPTIRWSYLNHDDWKISLSLKICADLVHLGLHASRSQIMQRGEGKPIRFTNLNNSNIMHIPPRFSTKAANLCNKSCSISLDPNLSTSLS